MSALRVGYLALALWGLVHPLGLFGLWLARLDGGLAGLLGAFRDGPAAAGLFWDLVAVSAALTLWALAETWARRNWSALWAVAGAWVLGPGFGLPLYLFLRSRPV
ncbi:DUF2834 domain-containing protein [Pseudooceanicola algae]|uniref:K+-transporting ATPase, A chain n=1 Tax=Pseudooceanicola algae TaxID=1537215 RepID=A0A418SKD2_9RHOB|nr:DUF2834 domain-containing protein [Pseudooceanicola algae]QPM90686.1 hypothetical protein PSAL_019250 [Pseudooceanicola algae]